MTDEDRYVPLVSDSRLRYWVDARGKEIELEYRPHARGGANFYISREEVEDMLKAMNAKHSEWEEGCE